MTEANAIHGPHPERVTDRYADARIEEKIATFRNARQRTGIRELNEGLKEEGVSPNVRLHLISAVVHLSQAGEETLPARLFRSEHGITP